MVVTYPRSKNAGNAEVAFPLLECWNPLTSVATIVAVKDGKRISCRISMEALKKRFSASDQAPMSVVAQHRTELRAAAKTLIEQCAFEDDGSITIG